MFKKSLASLVSAAVLVAGPGNLTLTAAAQTRGAVTGVSVIPSIGTGFAAPVPGASSFNVPMLTPGALMAPSLIATPSLVPAPVALAAPSALRAEGFPVIAAARAVAPNSYAALRAVQLPAASRGENKAAEQTAALNALFENSSAQGRATLEVLGQSAASVDSGLTRSASALRAAGLSIIERAAVQKARAGGELAIVSLVKRAWNAVLGMLGIGVKKLETPEVMAQRIIDQLNAQKPVYNRKVQEASTLVEALKLQIEGETKKVAELEQGITALLSDSDAANDIMASGMINQQKTLNSSIASTNEQIGLAEAMLVSIKEERTRFFSEREETLAKIQSGLTKSKSAEIQKQIAELKGGFQIGDMKDNMDKFEDAVNDKVADAKGTVDSVESNPDQILKKAKDSLKSAEIKDELARRKAAIEQAKKDKSAAGGTLSSYLAPIDLLGALGFGAAVAALITIVLSGPGGLVFLFGGAAIFAGVLSKLLKAIDLKKSNTNNDKGQAGGDASQSQALGYFAKAIGIGFALISPWISAAVFSLIGLVAIAMAPEQGRWLGRQLAVIGLGTLVIGGGATLAVAKLGLSMGAFGVGISFLVPALLALSVGVIATMRAKQKDGATMASVASTPAGSSVMMPVSTPSATVPAAPSSKISIKPLLDLLARAWNAVLGILGMGVKKMETPEIMAQRLIDQLNAAKPVYNNKVREAGTLVEKLRLQIESEGKKIADFDRTITALLSDNDAKNDIQAAGLLNSQKTLEASVAASKDQLTSSERALENIKEERARFFSEREETLAKIQAGLTKVKAAEISKQIAELKGGFQIGDLKDNLDRFDGAVNDKLADAKGTVDSVNSNPDQVLKKAKDSLRTAEIADELAKRKAAIEQAKKDKSAAGAAVGDYRGLTTTELIVLRLNAMAMSVYAGFAFGAPLLGLLGTFVAPIPVIYGYVVFLRLIGTPVSFPGVRSALGISWAGKSSPARDDKSRSGGLLLELGIGAAVIAVIAAVSAPFRNLLARAWNAALGMLGIGVKKLETPEIMAQRIIDQLNSQKPVYNRKVQEASTLVEKLRLQIEKQTAQSAELDRSVTALLSDSDPLNDVMAESLLNQKKTVDTSTTMTSEQLALSEKTLVSIKEERVSFFSEREEMLAKIQAGLTKSKSAEIQKQIAELKGGFQVGDLKDNMDRFDDAVNDKVADAKGTVDSVESNPDQILKKAKDSLKNAEVQDEIAKRKAAIEAAKKGKEQAGGKISDDSFNPKNWLYLKIGAALIGFLAALALVPEAFIPQALSQIGGALFMSWIFGKSDLKLDAIAFTVAIAAMLAVPLLAPAAMIVTALGAVGTAYFLFLLFA